MDFSRLLIKTLLSNMTLGVTSAERFSTWTSVGFAVGTSTERTFLYS